MATRLNSDPARKWTDAELESLERRIQREYYQAAREMRGKQAKWLEKFAREREQREKALDDTPEAREAHERWLRGQAARSEWFDEMVGGLSESAHRANVKVADIVNDRLPLIYSENANRAAFEVDKAMGRDSMFALADESTVRRLMGIRTEGADPTQLVRETPWFMAQEGREHLQDVRKREIDAAKDIRWNRQKFASAITQGILQGESIPQIVKRTESIFGQNRDAAVRAARTATTNAENAGRVDSYERAGRLGIPLVQEWMAAIDGRTRSAHRKLDGEQIEPGGTFDSELGKIRYPGDPEARPENVWNCFIGETMALPLGGIERSYRRFYDGDAVTVKTASGVEFTCTPNHPILTSEGWVAAGLLRDGDHLFVARVGGRGVGANPDVEHVGTSMEAIHELASVLAIERRGGVTVNFHEDVSASNVDVVAEERPLRVNVESFELEPVGELALKSSDALASGDSAEMEFGCGALSAPSSLMGGSSEPGAFFWGGVGHALVHSLGTVSRLDSRALEPESDGVATDVQLLCEGLDGFATDVFLDDVVGVDVHSVSCHVYNLQTESGAYLVTGNDSTSLFVVSHNCRCTLRARVKGFEDERQQRWAALPEGATYEDWKAMRAAVGPNGRALTRAEVWAADGNGRVLTPGRLVDVGATAQAAPTAGGFAGIAEGRDILGTWQRRPDEFDFEIEDVMNAQGFDGKPRIVDADEFDRAVRAANGGDGLIMQRTYSAPDQATLDAYRDMLYDGKWYVDCSTGGAQYGQGMYAAADYTGALSGGIKSEMEHYISLGEDRAVPQVMATKAKEIAGLVDGVTVEQVESFLRFRIYGEGSAFGSVPFDKMTPLVDAYGEVEAGVRAAGAGFHYVETMTLDPSAKIVSHSELRDMRKNAAGSIEESFKPRFAELDEIIDMDEFSALRKQRDAAIAQMQNMDDGSFAAAMGYDAINAAGHGASGSYTVVLNRTKLIIRRPE